MYHATSAAAPRGFQITVGMVLNPLPGLLYRCQFLGRVVAVMKKARITAMSELAYGGQAAIIRHTTGPTLAQRMGYRTVPPPGTYLISAHLIYRDYFNAAHLGQVKVWRCQRWVNHQYGLPGPCPESRDSGQLPAQSHNLLRRCVLQAIESQSVISFRIKDMRNHTGIKLIRATGLTAVRTLFGLMTVTDRATRPESLKNADSGTVINHFISRRDVLSLSEDL